MSDLVFSDETGNVGLRNLDVSWKDGVECEEIELKVSEMGDNSKCMSVLDDFCDEDVEKSSEIEINSSSMTVLDDNCKEIESRVSGMDDENNKRVKSAVRCCGMFDKNDDEINENAFRNFEKYSFVIMQVYASKEKG
ncbi:hypothetical protein Tco_0754791 [Tanacetum coccineum]